MTIDKPVAICIGIAAVVVLYAAFKVGKFIMKIWLMLVALLAIGLAVWWYFAKHHGA
jgi:hypothetical protein